jgi:hypothetical protein
MTVPAFVNPWYGLVCEIEGFQMDQESPTPADLLLRVKRPDAIRSL